MAVDREYRITISAVLSRSTAAALGDWVAQVTAAKAKVDSILAQPSKAASDAPKKEADKRVSEAKRAAAELERIREKENNEILRDVERHAKAQERAQERAQKHVAGIKERYFREEQRRGEQADAERRARNERIVSGSFDNMRKAAAAATRVAGELTSGFGVSFDLSSAMQRGIRVDEAARRTTISGKGALGQNASESDVQSTIAAVRAAGDASKQSYQGMAEGLEDFVSKSSDLETGKKVLGDLGRIARATGTSVRDIVSAAGDVNKTLDDSPGKAEELLDVMALVATQSAKGSVEVKDFAKYIPRITAGAFKFEGDRATNIGILAGLTQVAMRGGAAGPREATNAAQAFSQDITKGRALKEFEKAGIEIFADKGHTMLRSPEKIITDFLRKSKGSLSDLSTLFPNQGSQRVVTGYSAIYNAAGGGEKGIKAVEAEFKKFSETMSKEDIQKRADLAADSREAKAQAFQNKLDTIADSLATRVLPAFEQLAPTALKVSEAFANVVAWAASNPGFAIVGAIVASIGKAALGEMVGKALVGAMSGMSSKGLTIGTIAATVAMAYLAIREYSEEKKKAAEEEKAKVESNAEFLKRAQAKIDKGEKLDPEMMTEIIRRGGEVGGALSRANRYDPNDGLGMAAKVGLVGAKISDFFTGENTAKDIGAYEGGSEQNFQDKEMLAKQAAMFDALIQSAKDPKRNPSAEEIGGAVAKAVAPLVAGAPAAPTTGQVAQ